MSTKYNTVVPLWVPSPAAEDSQLTEFQRLIETKYGKSFYDYHEFYDWSIQHIDLFWSEFWHYSGVLHTKPFEEVIDPNVPMNKIPEWFRGSRLNIAENILRNKSCEIAIYEANEFTKNIKSMSFCELSVEVQSFSRSLVTLGVEANDRVVGYLPNSMLAVKAMLSAVTLGAIWSCTSPDFGFKAVVERFSQIQPTILFTVTKVMYNGKIFGLLDKIRQMVREIPSIKHVIISPHLDELDSDDQDIIPYSLTLSQFLKLGESHSEEVEFLQLPFNHPMYIMYSSGTTGVPKCMVHSAGGTWLQHMKEHRLMGNMSSKDIVFYYTTTGWMMWNWLVSCLSTGASIVLYDGSPFKPNDTILWDLVDKIGITVFGTSAKWLSVCEEKELKPIESHQLTSLKQILSTGSPLKPQTFDWVYENVKKDVLLGSITGGTDIISLFCGHNVNLPVYRGEIQCRHPGMAIESWDEEGKPVYCEQGELVCTKPFPSMPIRFWNDNDGQKYYNAYFKKFDSVWNHSDACLINKTTGGVVMLGRSDATLNPGGVRFGSAEIYNVVEKLPEIEDSVCVGQVDSKGEEERVVLFLKLRDGVQLTDDLISKVKTSIRQQLSARHVPSVILKTPAIPYTVSGKKVEMAVKSMISGKEVLNKNALAHPEVLDWYKDLKELADWL